MRKSESEIPSPFARKVISFLSFSTYLKEQQQYCLNTLLSIIQLFVLAKREQIKDFYEPCPEPTS